MDTIEVELLTGQGNYAIVRLPARKFPGVVIQGDTLSGLVADLEDIRDRLRRINTDHDLMECREQAASVARHLGDVQAAYESALREHDIPLPYVKGP